jgi:hypothetical protein
MNIGPGYFRSRPRVGIENPEGPTPRTFSYTKWTLFSLLSILKKIKINGAKKEDF